MNQSFVSFVLALACAGAVGCATLPAQLANRMEELAPAPPDET